MVAHGALTFRVRGKRDHVSPISERSRMRLPKCGGSATRDARSCPPGPETMPACLPAWDKVCIPALRCFFAISESCAQPFCTGRAPVFSVLCNCTKFRSCNEPPGSHTTSGPWHAIPPITTPDPGGMVWFPLQNGVISSPIRVFSCIFVYFQVFTCIHVNSRNYA